MKKLFAVIGDPIAHSMSPVMHNDLFQAYEIDAYYQPLHVKREDLEVAIKGLKAIGIAGFNVTVPHKEAIIPLLDELDPLAKSIGAVNTVVNENGKLIGFNTDGSGYVRGLLEELPSLQDKKVLVIGAGGAARGIYFTMAQAGVVQLDISNRTVSKANVIVSECPFDVQSEVLNMDEAEKNLGQYDLIIQTTLAGMAPNIQELPISIQHLKAGSFVSDIIYNPLETTFLQEAKKNGADIQNGLNMFVFQGALAFEKWTGIFPDTKRMRKIVLSQLGG
ncbi:shikimate dehydrogenase [Cytobacillus depressus]|uniref:Shikimate dehydrogenase (NADP(+)) n=1 Tax=Cytobacillus depressus TaxID=1602942 RepID=A0A6L3VC79_9BACI|nr:shikimate dehydrogenase [Cytobacillus depressus]KAB2338629.1 shikimate dehydrogenase [Cytobacillus depressus]